MSTPDYAERNRAAWNEAALVHQKQRRINLKEAVQSPTFSTFDDIEKVIFEQLDVSGKSVAQVCCNNGRELISVMKLGAASGVGFDISDEAIAEAQELGRRSNTPCEFVRTHIYDIDSSYFNRFDLVYITIGALCWFDNLSQFFGVVSQLLRSGGQLFVYEMHPFLDIFALPGEAPYDAENELKIAYSYFKTEPFVDTSGLDYIGNTTYESSPSYSFPHTLTDIFSSLLQNGLALQSFNEYGHDISNSFAHLQKYQKLPMCYTLIAEK